MKEKETGKDKIQTVEATLENDSTNNDSIKDEKVESQTPNDSSSTNADVIDLRQVFRKLWRKKHCFLITLPIAFVLSCLHILNVPRYYSSELKLAPELEVSFSGGTLSNIASNFGFDISNTQTSDAISPVLYPDLMDDNGFVANLFDVRISTIDDSIKTTYYDYLAKHQKYPWWAKYVNGIKKKFSSDSDMAKRKRIGGTGLKPYELTKKQNDITELIRNKITISVDKKNTIISINVKDQDPLVCKAMADTVQIKLQQFITEYRTNKSRVDVEYYRKLTREAWERYRTIRDAYIRCTDANTDVILASVRSRVEDLENDMQLKYTAYTDLQSQLQDAEAKLQARTPAFTLLKGASVPIKPAGPKRMIFVIAMLFFTFIGTAMFILRHGIMNLILGKG